MVQTELTDLLLVKLFQNSSTQAAILLNKATLS